MSTDKKVSRLTLVRSAESQRKDNVSTPMGMCSVWLKLNEPNRKGSGHDNQHPNKHSLGKMPGFDLAPRAPPRLPQHSNPKPCHPTTIT